MGEEERKLKMAIKWLEERWAVLLPALEPLGREQEEQIRALCEAEIAWWRQRPGLSARSLGTPMTLTRNRIREVLLVGEENSWINPRVGSAGTCGTQIFEFF